jgi:hypothetical protein
MAPEEATMERDPRKEGQAPWAQKVAKLGRQWAEGLGFILVDVDLAETTEYAFRERVNRIYLEASKNGG